MEIIFRPWSIWLRVITFTVSQMTYRSHPKVIQLPSNQLAAATTCCCNYLPSQMAQNIQCNQRATIDFYLRLIQKRIKTKQKWANPVQLLSETTHNSKQKLKNGFFFLNWVENTNLNDTFLIWPDMLSKTWTLWKLQPASQKQHKRNEWMNETGLFEREKKKDMYVGRWKVKGRNPQKTFTLFHLFNHKSKTTSTEDGSEVTQK